MNFETLLIFCRQGPHKRSSAGAIPLDPAPNDDDDQSNRKEGGEPNDIINCHREPTDSKGNNDEQWAVAPSITPAIAVTRDPADRCSPRKPQRTAWVD